MEELNVSFADIQVGDRVLINGHWPQVTARTAKELTLDGVRHYQYNPDFDDLTVRRPT